MRRSPALNPALRAAVSRGLAALHLQPQEVGRTLMLYAALLCVASIFTLGRTIRDTLFLSRYRPDDLPLMFVLYGVCSSPVALFFGRVVDRFRRERLFIGFLAFVAASDVAVFVLVRLGVRWIYPVYYLWADISANLMFVQLWTLANDLHTSRDAKRLYGFIGLGSVSGILLAGVAGRAALAILSVPQLLFVLIGLMAVLAVLVRTIAHRYPKTAQVATTRRAGEAPVPWKYVGLLACVLLATFTAAQVADYQFKLIAHDAFGERDLARFFALYYSVVGAIAFLFQVTFTQRILTRAGVFAGMLFMPIVIGAGSAWFLLAPGVLAASCTKFGDAGFQFTINTATYQILYFPFPQRKKAGVRMVIDGAAKPLGYTLGGLVLLLCAPHMSLTRLSLVTLPVVGIWIALAAAARRGYVRALANALAARSVGSQAEGPPDAGELRLLEQALANEDPGTARYAAERMLACRAADLPPIAQRLLEHRDAEIRRMALDAIGAASLGQARDDVLGLASTDAAPEVRATALMALGALAPDESLELLEQRLADPDATVRHGALAALLRYGSLDGVLAGGGTLRALLTSPRVEERVEAAEVLRQVGNASFYRPVADLLHDGDRRVRRAACLTAGALRHPRLVDPLLAAAAQRGSRSAAATALAAFGPATIEPIQRALRSAHAGNDGNYDREARRRLAGVLGRTGEPKAFEAALELAMVEEDTRVRFALEKGAVRLRERVGLPPPPRERWAPLLVREVGPAYELDAGREACLQQWGELPLLGEALSLQVGWACRRALRVLSLAYPPETLALIDRNLESGDASARANAVELLDNLLEPQDKRLVLPLVEAGEARGRGGASRAARERAARLREVIGLTLLAPPELLLRLAGGADPWLAACALVIATREKVEALAGAAEAALGSHEPLLRETAAQLLVSLGRRAAVLDSTDGGSKAMLGEGMYTTTEKILFLKGVGLFAQVPGEELIALAHSATVLDLEKGEPVVRQGEIGDSLFVVVRGQMRVEHDGREVARLGPGECFGEMSVLDREPRSATVIAGEPGEVLQIAQDDFYEILNDHPEIAEGILRVLTRRLRRADAAK